MEFSFPIDVTLPGRVTVVDSEDSNLMLRIYDLESLYSNNENKDKNWICNLSSSIIFDIELRKKKEHLENIIDHMGFLSAQAQGLQTPITTFKKLLNSSQQKIYIIKDTDKLNCVIGILKTGIKRLFICDDSGAHHQVNSICVLDFYVHESRQRCGFGHELFEIMLKVEKISPEKLAIDRPSPKFLAFLKKHYNLSEPIPQPNNFVVYPGFLNDKTVTRPPIFLYSKKEGQSSLPSSSKEKYAQEEKMAESLSAFNVEPVYLSRENAKSQVFNSSNIHPSRNTNNTLDAYYKKIRSPNTLSNNEVHSPYPSKNQRTWGVYDAMHSYSAEDGNFNTRNKNEGAQGSLTPVSSMHPLSQRQSAQLQSSWNVLGVKPMDYSVKNKNTPR